VVVVIGLVHLPVFSDVLPLPAETNLLRMMRAFRIFRLFNRVKSLKKIVHAILMSIPGVMNAFLILTIFMCIFSILAVELFRGVGEGCDSKLFDRSGFDTSRRNCMGEEYFGDFTKSIYTFFQVLTGESWSENIARPVIWYYRPDGLKSTTAAVFFVAFYLITSAVLANVVLAFLTDKLMSNQEEEGDQEKGEEAADTVKPPPPLPPLSKADKLISKELGRLHSSLGELGSSASDLQDDFNRAKSEMAEVKDQISLLVKTIERKYRLAAL